MKKIIGLLMVLVTLAILLVYKYTKSKKGYGQVEILEHKGSRFGLAQPNGSLLSLILQIKKH